MPISVISIPVTDQDRSKAFYRDVLGFAVIADAQFDSSMRWVQLAPPDGGATITLVDWFDSMKPGSHKGTVWSVPDLEAAMAELGDRGLTMSEVASAPWGSWTLFDDPDGNGWVLQQDTPM